MSATTAANLASAVLKIRSCLSRRWTSTFNVRVQRLDKHDLIFKTAEAKFAAVVADIKERSTKGQPVLVGTIAVETSEYLSELLKRQGVPHKVLNAKEHASEAEIIKDAGQVGSVTIATNMAGRGVDIKIDDRVRELGGLYVLGTERHEARRIDNQLRGRSGRQGDPGASQFYLSLEDDLMRLFGSERIASLMDRLGAQEGEVLTHPLITRSIGQAQKRVELQNFQSRKRLLDFDDVMNQQREVIYSLRSFALDGGEELKGEALKMVDKALTKRVDDRLGDLESEESWDLSLLKQEMLMHYLLTIPEFEGNDP